MARWQNFAEFGTAQENNYYYYWQREKLELQPGQDHSYDVWYEQPPGFYTQSRYSYSYAVAGSGPEPFMYEVAMHPAGTSVTPQETKLTTKFSAEGQDEDSLEGDTAVSGNVTFTGSGMEEALKMEPTRTGLVSFQD
ncbi:putative uncharacterized protein C6orf52 homolog isoform X2 [Fukomys damarensis]|uniref:putative uncharacterized protein C6orf52 homolog isoform X2 n=1 Tax=Fukomys damarensis TaxID=885580 RepID=UPI0014552DC6|nr:putative uncharacterized protein C6orf52 homolog isoform X2 [Fukomys damarensis]